MANEPATTSETVPGPSFWGNARDVGLVAVSALTFTGTAEYFSYLHEFGIDARTSADPATILMMSAVVMKNNLALIVFVGIVVGIALTVLWWRKSHLANERPVQIAFVAAIFAGLYFLAIDTGRARAHAVRMGESGSFVEEITMRNSSSTKTVSDELLRIKSDTRITVALETDRVIFLFLQPSPIQVGGKTAVPRGSLLELNRDDVSAIRSSIPDFAVP